jgi:ribonuclease P protein component
MDVLLYLVAAPVDVRNSPSAPKGSSRIAGFPKSVRILRSKDFRRVYDHGSRYSGPFFAAFYAQRSIVDSPAGDGVPSPAAKPAVGFTVPRSLGGAVVRNRIKRRVREAVRLRLELLNPQWEIVFNPRRAAMTSPLPDLIREVEKLFLRCNNS